MSSNELDPAGLEAIVFDLGGVLYGIDPPRTGAALQLLAGARAQKLEAHSQIFLDFEMGFPEPAGFRRLLRSALDTDASDSRLDEAWNALLLGPIPGRQALLEALAGRYRLGLLSNTNLIHAAVWGPECASMFALMEKTYFSFDLGLRKPDPAIYLHMLKDMGLPAEAVLFVDDLEANVLGAGQLGIRTLHIDPKDPDQFEQFCLKVLNKL